MASSPKTLRALFVLPALLFLAACTSSAPNVEGLTFEGATTDGFDLVEGTAITMSFSGDQVRTHAGCNTLFGAASWNGDRLTVADLASTEMGCAPALHAQDDALGEFLTNSPAVVYEGTTLVLTGATTTTQTEVRMELEEVRDADLAGTQWRLESLEENEGVRSLPEGVSASLKIDEGEAEIEFGCNTGGGEVTVTETTLAFGSLRSTRMACAEEAMAVEAHVSRVLQGTVDYEIDGDALRIHSGGKGLHFRAD